MLELRTDLDCGTTPLSAGAFAVHDGVLAVATQSGWATFAAVDLRPLQSNATLLPEGCNVKGVQLGGAGLLLLGFGRSQSFEHPADWDAALYRVGPDGEAQLELRLGPGNWRMVRHLAGERVVLYDVSEQQGLLAVEHGEVVWRHPLPELGKVLHSGGALFALAAGRVVRLDLAGQVHEELTATALGFTCTTAEVVGERTFLAGFRSDPYRYVLAEWRAGDGEVELLGECGLTEVFPAAEVEAIFTDACCPVDVHEVAAIAGWSGGRLLLGLGGTGVELGACEAASALALVSLAAGGPWRTMVLDPREGISGLRALGDGRVLLDLGGDLRLYEDTR